MGAKTPEYRAWEHLKNRVKSDKDAAYYRDRGVTVCDRWANSFAAFLEDMGRRPPGKKSVERKDNDKGYEPGNCVWATAREQNWNKRDTRLVTLNGETLPLSIWADRLGHKRTTVHARVKKGWSEVDALLTPVGRRNPHPAPKSMTARVWVTIRTSKETLKLKGLVEEVDVVHIRRALKVEGIE